MVNLFQRKIHEIKAYMSSKRQVARIKLLIDAKNKAIQL